MSSFSFTVLRRSPVGRLLIPLVAAFALLFGTLVPAQAVGASITGTVVSDAGGAPAANATVYLQKQVLENGSEVWEYQDYDYTDDSGSYGFAGQTTGTYRVSAEPSYNSELVEATTVAFPVGSSGTTTAPQLRLPTGGKISGTVSRTGSTPGYTSVTVYRNESSEGGWFGFKQVLSDANGAYVVPGLKTGTYRLGFRDSSMSPTHVEQFYNNKPTVELADDIAVTQGQTTAGKNAALARGRAITGTVTGVEGAKVANIAVTAYAQDGAGRWSQVASGYSDQDGSYRVAPLRAGSYRLEFRDYNGFTRPDGIGYDAQYYLGADTVTSADDIVVGSAADVAGKDISLALSGSVVGTISTPTGDPIPNVRAALYEQEETDGDDIYWNYVAAATTNEDGDYTIKNVGSGTYHLQFQDNGGNYLGEFYEDASSHDDAKPVVVKAATPTDVDADLELGGSISGVVTGPGGSHPAACVTPYVEVAEDGVLQYKKVAGRSAKTNSEGVYKVKGLTSASYKLRIDDCGVNQLVREYFDGARTLAAATPIAVTAGSDSPGRDVTLEAGATISGSVAGVGSYDVDSRIDVVDSETGAVVKSTDVEDGTYSVTGLAAGSYKVQFARLSGMASVAASFFKNIAEQTGLTAATGVDLVPGQVRSDVDATLKPGGHLKGRLVDGSGVPLDDYQVHAYTDDRSLVTRADYTDANGQFDIGGLTTGSYKLVANLGEQGTAGRGYYAGASQLSPTATSATPIAVTIGASKVLSGNVVLGTAPPVVTPPVVAPPVVVPPVVGPPAPPALRKVTPSVSVKIKGGKKKATLTVTVRARGVTPTGRIVVKLGSKTLKTVTLRNGRATIVLKKQKKGKKAYKVVYGGDSRVTNKTVTTPKVAIK